MLYNPLNTNMKLELYTAGFIAALVPAAAYVYNPPSYVLTPCEQWRFSDSLLAQSMFSDADTWLDMTSFLPETDFILELDLNQNHALH